MPRAGVASNAFSTGPAASGPARLEVLGVAVDRITRSEALRRCLQALEGSGEQLRVVTLNPEMVMAARRDPALQEAVLTAGLVLADGAGITWAARRLGAPLPERIAGADFLVDLAATAADAGRTVFLLGGRPGVAEAAGRRLRELRPEVRIGGAWAGGPAGEEAAALGARIRTSRAGVLAVAFGVPQQDLWLRAHLEGTGCAVGIGVGGTLDYLAGTVPRAPRVLRRAGLEWSFRLVRQPWRLPRMLRGASFFLEVLRRERQP